MKREDGRYVFKTESSVYELITPLQPEFGNFGVVVGNFEKEGFTALNSNHSSNQDAFAISKNRNLFAVSDGVGSRSESGAISRFITMKIAEELKDLNELNPVWIESKLKELQKDKAFLQQYKKTGVGIKEGGSATLAVVNRIAPGEFQITTLGDSPIYVIDANGVVVQEYATDSAGNTRVDGTIGISPDGAVEINGSPIRKKIKINNGEKIVMGSDYLSDGLVTYAQKSEHKIKDFEQRKAEGGSYEFDGNYILPSTLSDNKKKMHAAKFLPWGSAAEGTLSNMKNSLYMYNEVMKDPQKYLQQYKNDPNWIKSIQDWQKVASRNLNEFLEIKNGSEFYNKVTGPDSWKKDDATVIIIK